MHMHDENDENENEQPETTLCKTWCSSSVPRMFRSGVGDGRTVATTVAPFVQSDSEVIWAADNSSSLNQAETMIDCPWNSTLGSASTRVLLAAVATSLQHRQIYCYVAHDVFDSWSLAWIEQES